MTFLIITHVEHHKDENKFFAYAPYVREMNIWFKYVNQVEVVAPCNQIEKTTIDEAYQHDNIKFHKVEAFDINSLRSIFNTLFLIPNIFITIFKSMKQADHIHLRCPGNMGLIGCLAQILFPKKQKSAKYAGNWDPKATQPWSYRLQKWLLSNTFLTKNMQVLVYGDWPNQTKNIKPFFTATYSDSEIEETPVKNLNTSIKCLFVGALTQGKRPLYAIQLVEAVKKKGVNIHLELLGEGHERNTLENYICKNKLNDFVTLKGNQTKEETKIAYQNSHFLILPSKSEGWPKVVAEAMFWGCVPLVTSVSSVPFMVDYGKRGMILSMNFKKDLEAFYRFLNDNIAYQSFSENSQFWSRTFTVEKFESEIAKLLTT